MKKVKIKGNGNNCPKCSNPMQRREHTDKYDFKARAYYFKEWDYCLQCKHLQHYEEFKVNNERGHYMEEEEEQLSFLNKI